MKISDLSALVGELRQGNVQEHLYENVELKRGWTREYGEKASMLCNAQPRTPCYLVVGIEDSGLPSGHDERWLKDNIEKLSQHINQYLDPTITATDITSEDVGGSKIVIISLKNPGVVVRWNGKAFTGGGTTKRKLEDTEILELSLSLPGLTDITKQNVEYAPDAQAVELFCAEVREDVSPRILEKYQIRSTMAGRLLLGGGSYRFVKYRRDGGVLINENRKNLINALSDVTKEEIREFYRGHGIEPARITNELLRESLGNCVAHAAYQERDGEIVIELHPDRLVISNLAYREYTSLANKWFSTAHKSPNPFLMDALRVLDKVDELGRGKKKLIQECLANGFRMPVVTISDAARHKRWSLTVPLELSDERYRLLRSQLQTYYRGDREKVLIAYALVLWSGKSFTEVASHFDTYESQIATEIVDDINGPLFFWKERDQLHLHRWVKVLLEEGKASKGFSPQEEAKLFKDCQWLCVRHHGGLIKTAQLREYAHLSNSPSDRTLASKILTKWTEEGKIEKIKRGTYKFKNRQRALAETKESALKAAFARIIAGAET